MAGGVLGRRRWTRWVLAAAVVTAVSGTGAGLARVSSADLLDVSTLAVTDAQVTGSTSRPGLPERVDVLLVADGSTVEATLTADAAHRPGDVLAVAHPPGDPTRVRPVEGWAAPHETWLAGGASGLLALVTVAARHGMRRGAARMGRSLLHH